MKLELKQSELKTLKEETNGTWSYSIKTKTGVMSVKGIRTIDGALRSAEENLQVIIKSIIK
tara:strand:+ start:1445 stop:1627 length:183 start_codon:yes stop_codon:yes gene_type:complete